MAFDECTGYGAGLGSGSKARAQISPTVKKLYTRLTFIKARLLVKAQQGSQQWSNLHQAFIRADIFFEARRAQQIYCQ